jgi:putative ABC transport system ATP-binding protein
MNAPVLVAEDLAKVYPGPPRVEALKNGSMTAHSGEVTAILGRSGSGKTTLLSLLGLLERPTAGTLRVEGLDVSTASDRQRTKLRASHIGFLFQGFHLVGELTALQNVVVPLTYCRTSRRDREAKANAALASVGLHDRTHARAVTLSGGEQQRVALARALVREPRLILADEPTGNLDSATERSVIDLLAGVAGRGCAVIVVTHNHQVADAAHAVFTMHDGVLGRA